MQPEKSAFDDQGMTAGRVTELGQRLLHAFDNDRAKLAVALGRSEEEISHALSGNAEAIDDDLVMKMKGIAQERGIEI